MKWLKNPWIARAIALVVILTGVWISARRTLGKMYRNTVSVWEEEDGVRSELESKAGHAANLLVVAGRYLSQEDLLPLNEAKEALLDSLNDPSEAGTASSLVTKYALETEETLENYKLSEKDKEYVRGSVSQILAADEIIGHCSYNEVCQEYNGVLRSFPAQILAGVTGTKEAGMYEENAAVDVEGVAK